MIIIEHIKAISLDLDDTLWPILPVLERAEKALLEWLGEHAPMTAAMFASPVALHEINLYMLDLILKKKPEMAHDLGAIRKESIRLALYRAGDNPLLADAAYEAFFIKRNEVAFYEDALPALSLLSAKYPLVAVSNGNAQLSKIGIDHYFKAGINATKTGFAKPSPEIFYIAAQSLGVKPEEVLHVGDDAQKDVLGALNAGMQAVWLNRQGKQWDYAPLQPNLEISSLGQLTALPCKF